MQFSELEVNILKSKGLSEEEIQKLVNAGVKSKSDFSTVGNAETLAHLINIAPEKAQSVMTWAMGVSSSSSDSSPTIVVDNPDIVYCAYCKSKQPKDYKSGDLCFSCGKQVEPIATCYWCATSGPGKFCRNCGATFVPVGELELALQLKSEGISKDEIAKKLVTMNEEEKRMMWEKIRRPHR